MKRIIFLLSLFGFPALCLQTVYAQNHFAQQSGTEQTLHSIYFTDQYHGWAVGESGTVLSTNDGGETWYRTGPRMSGTIRDVAFFDEFTGWITGDDNLLFFTDDGGRRWADRRPSPVSGQHLYSVYAHDWRRIAAAGGPGKLLHFSSNGGATWSTRHRDGSGHTFSHVHFSGNERGTATDYESVYVTDDGGRSWTEIFNSTETEIRTPLITPSGDIYFILNYEETGSVYRISPDSAVPVPVFNSEDGRLSALALSGNSILASVSRNGSVFGTTDAGSSWFHISSVNTGPEINAIHLSGSGTIRLAGEQGVIFRIQSDLMALPFRETELPHVAVSSEDESVELMNRALRYGEKAEKIDNPAYRRAYYKRVRAAIEGVQAYYRDSEMPRYIRERVDELAIIFRTAEHNTGADAFRKFQTVSDPGEADLKLLDRAIEHFENAVLLLPDSTESIFSLAYIQSEAGYNDDAIYWLRKIFETSEDQDKERHDLLIRLYLEENRTEDARNAATVAHERFPDERLFLEYLAELELKDPGPETSPEALNRLIDADPENTLYRYVRGTQTFMQAFERLQETVRLHEERWRLEDRLLGASGESERNRIQRELRRVESNIAHTEREGDRLAIAARNDLESAVEFDPGYEDAHLMLGVMGLNRAAILEEIKMLTQDESEARRLDRKINEFLTLAKTHYEHATQLNPRNREAWENLYRIYLLLNMPDEAERVQRRL
jgi:photosystem II stability/assembly factor-like uncharacterized protein/tetratricopeptide (TPR) repeat protein